jgi:serpin B
MRLVDFAGNPAAAERLINEWASQQTRGRIPEVLAPGTVTAAWRLALANAIYLKAPWLEPFDPQATRIQAFTMLDGSAVDVPMMTGRMGTCATGDDWQAARLPYVGDGLSMLVIVPDRLAAFEARLDSDVLTEIAAAFEARYANAELTLPRFDIETKKDLVPDLVAIGLTEPFGSNADFTGMTTGARLAMGTVIHQANITVDEAGTEAAAVTIVGMDTAGSPTPTCTVSANRPFLFALQDNDTGAVLFLGHVVDPSDTRS